MIHIKEIPVISMFAAILRCFVKPSMSSIHLYFSRFFCRVSGYKRVLETPSQC